jgi:hypothetical protein
MKIDEFKKKLSTDPNARRKFINSARTFYKENDVDVPDELDKQLNDESVSKKAATSLSTNIITIF